MCYSETTSEDISAGGREWREIVLAFLSWKAAVRLIDGERRSDDSAHAMKVS